MSEVNMAIADLGIVQRGIGRRIGVGTYPPFAETRAGETATERKTRSTEPRATVAHSPRGFQPTHTHNNSIVTWGIDEPTLRRKVADVNDSSEPAKFPGRDFAVDDASMFTPGSGVYERAFVRLRCSRDIWFMYQNI